MSYLDKILWYDQDDRYIPTENKKEGWDWDFEKVSVRHRGTQDGDMVSIELWGRDGDSQEVLLTKQNAMRLADTLKMAVVEFTVEEMMWRNNQDIQELNKGMNWLKPVIEKEKQAWVRSRKEKSADGADGR